MILTKTPLRLEFAGGSTDIRNFYSQEKGCITSAAIDKHIYIAIHKYFYPKILLKYAETELVDNVNDIKHSLFRECLKLLNITKGIEITVISDLPSGTGIGTSSSFTVGLLHALHAYKGEHVSAEQLAQEACFVEIELAKAPIGKQDQYMAAYGGLNYIEFNPDESVAVRPIICQPEVIKKLNSNLLMFFTGHQRSTNTILEAQHKNALPNFNVLRTMKKYAQEARDALIVGDLDRFAQSFHDEWTEKKKLHPEITNPELEGHFDKAFKAGAKARRLVGAGGGGFILLYCERDKQDKVRLALSDLRELVFKIDFEGSRVAYVGR